MEKRGAVVGFFITLFALAVFLHTIFHFFVFGTGIAGFVETGVSGFSVGENDLKENLIAFAPLKAPMSKAFLLAEWLLILVFVVFFIARNNVLSRREYRLLSEKRKTIKNTSVSATDLDNLHEMLKQSKSLKVSTITKVYGVDKNIVMSWGQILQSGNLMRIDYPWLGEPRFIYSGEKKESEK